MSPDGALQRGKVTRTQKVRTILFGPLGVRGVRFLYIKIKDISDERQSLGTWRVRQSTVLPACRKPEDDENDGRYTSSSRGSKGLHGRRSHVEALQT